MCDVKAHSVSSTSIYSEPRLKQISVIVIIIIIIITWFI